SDINGAEMVTVLRDSGFRLPVLFLSGETDLAQQLLSLENGGDDFMVKPVLPEHLVTTVTAHAKRSRRSNAISYRLKNTLYEREREHLALDHHSIVSAADKLGNITYVNDRFCEVSGYSRDELLGRNHRIIKSGKHAPEFYLAMWDTIAQGDVWHGETCNKCKDGSLFWVESTITPFLDSEGVPYQYVAIRTDISQIKESEQALHAIVNGTSLATGEAFFRSSVQNLAESMNVRFSFIAKKNTADASTIKTIAIWDTDHIIDNFSYPVKDTPCEHVLSTGLSVYSGMVAESFPKDLWLKENGIESYIGIPLFGSNGDFLGHMGVIDDKPMSNIDTKINLLRIFAASVAGEMERGQSEAALQASESHLNFLVSSSPVTIYTSEATPPFAATYISPNIKQLMGYEPEQFTNSSSFWAENIHPDDQQEVFDNLPQLFEHGTHIHEYRYLKQDGSYSWMRDELRLIKDESGVPVEIVGYWADINDRKVTEQALKINKERLRRGQIFANIGTWDWNIVTGELFWSERIGPLFGYAEGELETSYDNFLNAIHPDDRQLVIDAVNNCVEHGKPYDIEHRVVWPDGTVRWLHERGAVASDADGKALQMLGVVNDIDDRKKAESALVENEEKLRSLYEHSPVGIALNGMDGRFIEANQGFLDIIGYTDEECRALTYWQLTPEEYATQEAQHLESLNSSGHYGPYEKEYIHKGGHRVAVLLNGSVVHDRDGNKRIWSIVQDISKRKNAELAMQESEERFAFAVEGAGDGIWDWDMKTSVMQFSRLYMEMLGFAENELPQHVDSWVGSVHPDDLARVQKKLQEYLEGKTTTYHVELRLRCKDGSYKWILCRGTIVDRDEEGNAVRMIGIHSDISERKESEQNLIIAREEADNANRAKSQFLSSMSH
ncbi:MAG: PAS domain-containing protein, partial [Gammaproteobacteria bacterium]|nr:PAS domain-containing protein [Gammaproteobacteria bacterium]